MPPHGVTLAGNPAPIQIQEELTDNILDAPETRQTFRGEREATFAAYPNLRSGAARASVRQDGASAVIERIFKDPTRIVETVEIDFNAVHREWWTAPGYAALTRTQRAIVTGALRRLENFKSDSSNTSDDIDSYYNDLLSELNLRSLGATFEEVFFNGETYAALLPVITYTLTVAPTFNQPFYIADIGCVFSTAAMNAQVPLNPQIAVSEVTNTISPNALQALGWLKTGRYGISSDGSAQYIQQYIFDAYPNTARYTFIT